MFDQNNVIVCILRIFVKAIFERIESTILKLLFVLRINFEIIEYFDEIVDIYKLPLIIC